MIKILEVKEAFADLNSSGIQYALLRNIGSELPHNISREKDIDIIVHPNQIGVLERALLDRGWRRLRHPYEHKKFLYGMDPFHFYSKGDLYFDVCFQISCQSINDKEWFPLDQEIQRITWQDIHLSRSVWQFELSPEVLLVHLITRCVFDKRKFSKAYIKEIERVFSRVDVLVFEQLLSLVFFKFTRQLIVMLRQKKYSNIFDNYIQFSDY